MYVAQISDSIEQFIKELMDADNEIELKRNELAQHFGCVPSQINYVLSTRFSVQHGYVIQSKRGGGGYIRIVRVRMDDDRDLLSEMMDTIGQEITQDGALALISRLRDLKLASPREAALMSAAVQDAALGLPVRAKDMLRAGVLKNMIEQVFMMNE
jgi:transcriptional regulator CtsR